MIILGALSDFNFAPYTIETTGQCKQQNFCPTCQIRHWNSSHLHRLSDPPAMTNKYQRLPHNLGRTIYYATIWWQLHQLSASKNQCFASDVILTACDKKQRFGERLAVHKHHQSPITNAFRREKWSSNNDYLHATCQHISMTKSTKMRCNISSEPAFMGAAIFISLVLSILPPQCIVGWRQLRLAGKGCVYYQKMWNINPHGSSKMKKLILIDKYKYIFNIWAIWTESDHPTQRNSAVSRYWRLGGWPRYEQPAKT